MQSQKRSAALLFFAISVIGLRIFLEPPVAAQIPPQARPSPTATPVPAILQPSPTPAVQTLADLTSLIRDRISRYELRRGRIGVKILSSKTGKVIFENDADKYFMPASNMKNFTVAAALEKLTPDYRFVTSVYADSKPDESGIIRGNLRIFGRGDVSVSTAFAEGNYYKALDDLADKIALAGVKRVDGDLVGDDSYFIGDAVPGTWEVDDLQWYYGAEVSALPINDNAVDLTVAPGPAGYLCSVRINPVNPVIRVVNLCKTVPAGSRRELAIVKRVNQNVLEVNGLLPIGDSGFSGSVTFSRPAELFVALLKERLALKGVVISGAARILAQPSAAISPNVPQIEIARLESPPLSLIAAKTLKPSQNMYTETILRTLGETLRQQTLAATIGVTSTPQRPTDSAELGIQAVSEFLTRIGVPADAVVQYDGSGLSRHNLITPAAVAMLYTYMDRQSRFSQAWRDSLTIAGVDGTLRNRFRGTRASGNLRGKTGTIDQVSALSGYLTTAGGEPVVLSIIVNGVPDARQRTTAIDDIVIAIANFSGRID